MTTTGLIMTMAVMPIVVALTVGLGGVWLTGDVRVVGLVELAAAIVGAGLEGTSTGERGFDVGFLMGPIRNDTQPRQERLVKRKLDSVRGGLCDAQPEHVRWRFSEHALHYKSAI